MGMGLDSDGRGNAGLLHGGFYAGDEHQGQTCGSGSHSKPRPENSLVGRDGLLLCGEVVDEVAELILSALVGTMFGQRVEQRLYFGSDGVLYVHIPCCLCIISRNAL